MSDSVTYPVQPYGVLGVVQFPQLSATDGTTLVSGGSGYAAGDTITLPHGVVISVTQQSGGAISQWQIVNRGSVAIIPPNPANQVSTTGAGTGASFNLSWGDLQPSTLSPGTLGTNAGSLMIGGEQPAPGFSGPESTFIGVRAGSGFGGVGGFNTCVGHNSGGQGVSVGQVTTGGNNVFVGTDAGRNITGTPSSNTGVGRDAGRNTGGSFNTFVGAEAGYGADTGATTANNNSGFGYGSIGGKGNLTTGANNTGLGANSGFNLTTGASNTIVGYNSGVAMTTGGSNTTVGTLSGNAITSGAGNTLVGLSAGQTITTGVNNTIIGQSVGSSVLTTGSGNIYIGVSANIAAGSANEGSTFRLGNHATNLMRATGINTATPAFFLDWMPASTSFASDAAAATGGVAVGQIYRNGSVLQCRIS